MKFTKETFIGPLLVPPEPFVSAFLPLVTLGPFPEMLDCLRMWVRRRFCLDFGERWAESAGVIILVVKPGELVVVGETDEA